MLKNTIQGILILVGILLSFHIEESRIEQNNFEIKNELLSDLNRAINNDLEQIINLKEILKSALDSISELQDDMNKNHQLLSDEEVIKKLIDLNVSISFFPQDGIFTELISSGSFELIKNKELKSKLLEIYNHQKERNLSISDDIDVVMKDYELEIMTNFRIAIDYASSDGKFYGKPILSDYEFNRDYYLSNKLYGLMSLNYLFGVMYSRLLDDFEKSHEATLALSMLEIGKS